MCNFLRIIFQRSFWFEEINISENIVIANVITSHEGLKSYICPKR